MIKAANKLPLYLLILAIVACKNREMKKYKFEDMNISLPASCEIMQTKSTQELKEWKVRNKDMTFYIQYYFYGAEVKDTLQFGYGTPNSPSEQKNYEISDVKTGNGNVCRIVTRVFSQNKNFFEVNWKMYVV